jgi:hypothetical protein
MFRHVSLKEIMYHSRQLERNNVPFTSTPIINAATVASKPTNMKFDLNKNKTSR